MFKIKQLILGYIHENCYIAYDTVSNKAIIIDPGDCATRVIDCVNSMSLSIEAILLTHGHFDHIGAADSIRKEYNCPIYIGEKEYEIAKDVVLNESATFHLNTQVIADVCLKDNENIRLAGLNIIVMHTPGHTIGSVCYYLPDQKVLFSGDTLFYGTYGRTDFHTGSENMMLHSIKDKLLMLSDDIVVYPGHNESTTIGDERYNY